MHTGKINSTSFTGFGAARLRALCLTRPAADVSMQLSDIGQKIGFDVFVASNGRLQKPCTIKNFEPLDEISMWAQDIAVTAPNNQVTAGICDNALAALMNKKFFKSDNNRLDIFAPPGGNLYFIENPRGNPELLIGDKCAEINNPRTLKALYDVSEVHLIPQMDFHLDLFIRPLDKQRVLVTDDDLTQDVLNLGVEKINDFISKNDVGLVKKSELNKIKDNLNKKITDFIIARNRNPYKNTNTNMVCDTLESIGCKPIRVPGRYYFVGKTPYSNPSLYHNTNYMNAVVPIDKDGKMHFITNKSLFDENLGLTPDIIEEIGFSFENEFIKSLSGIIPKENIYFMRGARDIIPKTLVNSRGGIHCMVSEVPE